MSDLWEEIVFHIVFIYCLSAETSRCYYNTKIKQQYYLLSNESWKHADETSIWDEESKQRD